MLGFAVFLLAVIAVLLYDANKELHRQGRRRELLREDPTTLYAAFSQAEIERQVKRVQGYDWFYAQQAVNLEAVRLGDVSLVGSISMEAMEWTEAEAERYFTDEIQCDRDRVRLHKMLESNAAVLTGKSVAEARDWMLKEGIERVVGVLKDSERVRARLREWKKRTNVKPAA